MPEYCSCCSKITETHLLLCCCVCKKQFNNNCVGLSASETRLIHGKKSLAWTCNDCNQIGNDINSLRAAIVSLQNQIKAITVEAVPTSISNNDFEEVVQEIRERQKKQNNIILFGMKEQNGLSKDDRLNAEKDDVLKILTHLSPNFGEITNLYRLGKYDKERVKPRPVKVCLANSEQGFNLLKKSSKLKESEDFKNVSIGSDQTPRQLEYYKEVKKELDERTAAGETNIKIKHINGIPKILNF